MVGDADLTRVASPIGIGTAHRDSRGAQPLVWDSQAACRARRAADSAARRSGVAGEACRAHADRLVISLVSGLAR